ncbi:hypothetical protein AGDE_13824 [Angomonas deanei]|uniref:Uncharacterized protein n=1 Tax=Angomonas deanei TaxID=59799 RepID=A0A7G2CL75_9TRYP|nr:hypothetical protein AGDE_13824 [Angomonas deanei]CAD2220576.1 hypothetical protein, conserved [Angomonas deanei]|eukprot:EPY21692.1 hypothetical protein AGDE_13824 [Angomonas deanei]
MNAVEKEKNPLAIAIKKHWDTFLKEQNYKKQGNDETYNHMKSKREKKVKAVKSAEEAKTFKLTEDAIDKLANNFVSYAVSVLGHNKWGGDFEYDVDGIIGKAGTLKISGKVVFFKDNKQLEEPYEVVYDLFISA